MDTLLDTVARSDTVRTFSRPVAMPAGGFLAFTTELPVTAGHYLTHAGVFDSSLARGTASAWGNIVVQPAEFSMSDVSGVFNFGAKYSAWLEYGTVKMEPRPFARPALANKKSEIEAIVDAEIRPVLT